MCNHLVLWRVVVLYLYRFFPSLGSSVVPRGMTSQSGISPGNVPVYHGVGSVSAVVERRMKAGEVALRCSVLVFGLTAAVLVATDTQVKSIFSIQKKAKFSDMKALLFFVTTNAVASGCSLLQGLRCVVSMVNGSVLFSKTLAWFIFSCDQVVAYVTLAAIAAAAESAEFAENGQPDFNWMRLCNIYGRFCTQVGEGMATSVVVGISSIALSCMSAFNLFRLYGNSKKSSGSW